jgi:hypothetical protein
MIPLYFYVKFYRKTNSVVHIFLCLATLKITELFKPMFCNVGFFYLYLYRYEFDKKAMLESNLITELILTKYKGTFRGAFLFISIFYTKIILQTKCKTSFLLRF